MAILYFGVSETSISHYNAVPTSARAQAEIGAKGMALRNCTCQARGFYIGTGYTVPFNAPQPEACAKT